jgi:hypothetical protein
MKRVVGLAVVVVLTSVVLASCQTGVTMWGACSSAGDRTGTDGTYVLLCENGEWTPIMTVHEFVEISRGGHPTIGNLPQPSHQIDVNNMTAGDPSRFVPVAFCSGVERDVAQTFRAGITGRLDQIAAIVLRKNDVKTLDVSIQGASVNGHVGSPDGVWIGSGSYSGPGSPDPATPTQIPLAQPANVVAGHWYTVVFSASDTGACTNPQAEWDVLGNPVPANTGQPFGPGWSRVILPPGMATCVAQSPCDGLYWVIYVAPDFLLTTWVRPAG